MKKNKIISIITLGLLLFFSSCVKDLDVTPIDENVLSNNNVYSTPDGYKQTLAKIYASFILTGQKGPDGDKDTKYSSDEGFSGYLRQLWNHQVLPTEEAMCAWANDAGAADFHFLTWNSSNTMIQMMYARIFFTIVIANEYIRNTANKEDADIKKCNAEARFLRAMAYYHALDLFGNPVFVTEEDVPGTNNPKQTTRAALFAYIESELKAIENLLGEPRFAYARADKAAAWFLLARLYLNAKVYTGSERYTDCITYCNKIFNAGYTLDSKYFDVFGAENNTSPEIIFLFAADGAKAQSWGGMTFIYNAAVNWGGNRATKALFDKFNVNDKRAMLAAGSQGAEINEPFNFAQGFKVTKFHNTKRDGVSQGSDATHPDTDFPMFRLTDAYLMYAEAILRGGSGGNIATALTYINNIRFRAYGDVSGNIAQGDLTLDFILNERCRELYWECTRRTDLIRYDLFTNENYLWPWKGGVKDGKAVESWRKLFPIPASEIAQNSNYKQNPGY